MQENNRVVAELAKMFDFNQDPYNVRSMRERILKDGFGHGCTNCDCADFCRECHVLIAKAIEDDSLDKGARTKLLQFKERTECPGCAGQRNKARTFAVLAVAETVSPTTERLNVAALYPHTEA